MKLFYCRELLEKRPECDAWEKRPEGDAEKELTLPHMSERKNRIVWQKIHFLLTPNSTVTVTLKL